MWILLLIGLFIVVSIFMMLVILVQKPRGGGLSGAFGGGGGSESSFMGRATGDFLTWTTVVCFVLFLLLAMGMQWTIRAEHAPTAEATAANTAATPGAGAGAGAGPAAVVPPQPGTVIVPEDDVVDEEVGDDMVTGRTVGGALGAEIAGEPAIDAEDMVPDAAE